ncbi:glycosyltransferase family 4 protein [Candidatus Villigracilis vicinus]|uniref:glycosyltransferase family 4 protein n=1 Tax=Candidatus Villigracilis vicinus TaxID=3140679 RepID=UPI0031E73E1B
MALNEKLNILMVTHHRRFKSRPRSHAMAKHLVQRGHKVTLIVIADQRRFGIVNSEWDGVQVIETPDLLWGQLRSGWDPWDLLNRILYLSHNHEHFDLIHCFETRPATIYPALLYSRRHDIPLVTDWNDWWGRGGLIDEVRPAWYRLLFGTVETYYEEAFRTQGAGLTVISSALGRRAEGLGVCPERILHLPSGTFPEIFRPREKMICRERFGLPFSTPVIGFSSLDSHLDLGVVLQALAIVARQYPSVKLIITGKPSNAVVELVRTYGVESNVHLTGYLQDEELPWALSCADLFVLPLADKVYNVGRWPNKICDYMSLGRPTVSNPVGDIKGLFEDHKIGVLASWDPVDFSEKILYLLKNPEIAFRLGDNARDAAVTVYDWKLLVCRLEEFYATLLNVRSPSLMEM